MNDSDIGSFSCRSIYCVVGIRFGFNLTNGQFTGYFPALGNIPDVGDMLMGPIRDGFNDTGYLMFFHWTEYDCYIRFLLYCDAVSV